MRRTRFFTYLSLLLSLSVVSTADKKPATETTRAEFTIDAAVVVGKIRPLHGVNGGSVNAGGTIDLTAHWREAAIPLTRLHDCEWPGGRVVDLHSIVPDLTRDLSKPESYRFDETDDYLTAVLKATPSIVFRLGESIEHTPRKYHVHPPKDIEQWAKACRGIIRHYNEGWANGFHHGIQYWEIWNEPENRPAMWTGTDADYFRIYNATARAIKAEFPTLKIGGPAVGASGEIVDGEWRPTQFMEDFLKETRDSPLDFFSWHTYTDDPATYRIKARGIRRWLDAHDRTKTEIHLNEWNFLPGNTWNPLSIEGQGAARREWYAKQGGLSGAAFITAVLIDLQESPVDVANLFTGDSGPFGLFTQHGEPKPTFHAVKAFRRLLETPLRLHTTGGEGSRIYLAAGINAEKSEIIILISHNRTDESRIDLSIDNLPWPSARIEDRRLNAQQSLDQPTLSHAAGTKLQQTISLSGPEVVLLKLREPVRRP